MAEACSAAALCLLPCESRHAKLVLPLVCVCIAPTPLPLPSLHHHLRPPFIAGACKLQLPTGGRLQCLRRHLGRL